MRPITLLFFAILLSAPPALAQEHVFSPGGRLRIEAPSLFPGRMEGTVREYTHEGVHFEASNGGGSYLVAPFEIRYLAKYRGEDRAYVMKRRAATLGFITGAVGAVAGPGVAIGLESNNLFAGAAIGAVSGAVLGAAAGAVWGSRHRGDVWREYRIIGIGRSRDR